LFDDDERMRELEERYEGYEVYDRNGEKIGKVDDLFVDETDREEYIGVKMGLFGLSGTTMIPMDIARVNETERTIEVAETKEHVKDAPNYSDEDDIDLEFEARIRDHFGLEGMEASPERGTYGSYPGATAGGGAVGGGAVGGAAAGATAAGPGMEREPGGMDRGGDLGGMDRGEPRMDREPGGIDRGEPGGIDRDLGTTGGVGREPGSIGGEPGGMDREPAGIDRDLGGMERGDQTREMPSSSAEGGQEESMGTRVRRRVRRIVEE
jgi:sporulation protein YlmC with PRC-barrel domain